VGETIQVFTTQTRSKIK